jgi:hypothetical protein
VSAVLSLAARLVSANPEAFPSCTTHSDYPSFLVPRPLPLFSCPNFLIFCFSCHIWYLHITLSSSPALSALRCCRSLSFLHRKKAYCFTYLEGMPWQLNREIFTTKSQFYTEFQICSYSIGRTTLIYPTHAHLPFPSTRCDVDCTISCISRILTRYHTIILGSYCIFRVGRQFRRRDSEAPYSICSVDAITQW